MTDEDLRLIARWLQDHGFAVVVDYHKSEIRLLLEPHNNRF